MTDARCAGEMDRPPRVCQRCGATRVQPCGRPSAPVPSPEAVRALVEAAAKALGTLPPLDPLAPDLFIALAPFMRDAAFPEPQP